MLKTLNNFFFTFIFIFSVIGCSGGDDLFECSTGPAPSISSSPPTSATAGFRYSYNVDATYSCFPFVCSGITGVSLPQGASVYYSNVSWTPSVSDIGKNVFFKIATKPDSCGNQVTQSWYVRVYAPPVIDSFTANTTAISLGDTVTLTAYFEGNGYIEGLGPVVSGKPITTPPLNATTEFTLSVKNSVGAEIQRHITINLLDPPIITFFSAWPPIITVGDSSDLRWSLAGDYSIARLDPMGTDVLGYYQTTVSPSVTLTYSLYVANDANNSIDANTTIEVVAVPNIQNFTATPPTSIFKNSVILNGIFTYGTAVIEKEVAGNYINLGTVLSGEDFDSGELLRSTRFRLVITNTAGMQTTQTLMVPISGPGTFQPTTGQPIHPLRNSHTATRLLDGKVFIAGGSINNDSTATTEIFDPSNETFSAGPNLLEGRQKHTASLLLDGRVLLVGGYNSTSTSYLRLLNAELYDPNNGEIVSAGLLPLTDLIAPKSIRLLDGQILIVHGFGWQGAEVFDPKNDIFTPVGPLNATHGYIALEKLPDKKGDILIIDGNPANQSEIFSPLHNSSSLTDAVTYRRYYYTSATMNDGRILITGHGLVPSEIYDPQVNTFSNTDIPNFDISGPKAVTLNNGQVLIVGGYHNLSDSPWAELYDPITNQFIVTGGLREGHHYLSVTLLSDGRVLVIGGCRQLPCEAEIYTP